MHAVTATAKLLRQWRKHSAHLAGGLPSLQKRRQNLQGPNKAVAGRGKIRKNNMARLFAAEIFPNRPHALGHVAVTHPHAVYAYASFGKEMLEPEVGHDGCHNPPARQ